MAKFSERSEKWVTIDEDELKDILADYLKIDKHTMTHVVFPTFSNIVYSDKLTPRNIRIYLNG